MYADRIVACAVVAAFFLGYLVWRWRSAAETPAPRAAAWATRDHRVRATLDALERDDRFAPLLRNFLSRYRATFDGPSDPETYRICHIAMIDETGDRVLLPHAGRARYVAAYLQRDGEPARLQATLDLRTGAVSEMPANAVVWQTIPPTE